MTEEATPQDGQQPVDGGESTTPADQPAPEPTYVTREQLDELISKQDQRLQTWLGRRDADLIDKIKERMAPPPDPGDVRDKMMEDPQGFFRTMQQQVDRERTARMNDVLAKAGGILDTDPLYDDKAFGNEVVNEIKRLAGNIDPSLSTAAAAKMLVSDATLAVERKRRAAPKNPLAGNTPQNTGEGIKPAAGGKKKPPKVELESDLAKRMAAKWGYSDEKLAELFGKS